jgi:hypothetical protein
VRRFFASFVVDVGDDDSCVIGGAQVGGSAANARRPARDQDNLIAQIHA